MACLTADKLGSTALLRETGLREDLEEDLLEEDFGGAPRGAPRRSNVNLSQDDKNAKKGSITQFQGRLQAL